MDASPVQLAASAALALTCVIGLVVGVRTLRVWTRTRQLAELAIGLNIASVSAGAALMVLLANAPGLARSSAGTALFGVSALLLASHVLALWFGTWRIFRAAERWPLVLCGPAALAMLVYLVWAAAELQQTPARTLFYETVRLLGFAWTSAECFRTSSQIRRRARLGLGDAFVAHRISLWGIASVSQLTATVLSVVSTFGLGVRIMDSTAGLLTISVLGLSGSVCIALAFFPPRAYARWVAARGPA